MFSPIIRLIHVGGGEYDATFLALVDALYTDLGLDALAGEPTEVNVVLYEEDGKHSGLEFTGTWEGFGGGTVTLRTNYGQVRIEIDQIKALSI